jgi:osmotically-inducible protein OsmY
MKFATQKIVVMLALSACLAGGLSACAPLMIGGVVVGGMMATDRRTTGTQVEDTGIELHAASAVRHNLGERVHVNVTSYNRQVLLTGEVPNAQDKQLLEQVVSKVQNVRSIVNETSVSGISTFTQRTSDALVSGRVRARILDAKDLFINAFKVVTESGTTYLMGRVTQREANRVTEIARGTDGVQKVVRLLEIISEEELQSLQPQPAPADAKK